MNTTEEKQKRRYGRVDLVCDVLATVCLLVMFILVALYWGQLPDRIPTHYGIDGQPNAWGGKSAILLLPVISLIAYGGLTLVRFLPDSSYNYPVPVTEENRERLGALSRELLSALKAGLLLAFLPMLVFILKGLTLPLWYLPLLLLLVFGPVVFYIVRMVKNK